jgi:hypothetical protein
MSTVFWSRQTRNGVLNPGRMRPTMAAMSLAVWVGWPATSTTTSMRFSPTVSA